MFAYCNNNPISNIDPNGNCFFNAYGEWCHDNWEYIGNYERQPNPLGNNGIMPELSREDYSWANEEDLLTNVRHASYQEALNDAYNQMLNYAQNHDMEVGYFIYFLYGGYYVSHPTSNMYASNEHVKTDITTAPYGAIIISKLHTHITSEQTLIYRASEYNDIVKTGWAEYVVDAQGNFYVLNPQARNYTEYTKLR